MQMKKALSYRIGAGKALGLGVGLVAFFLMPIIFEEPSLMLRSALLLWYATLGALVGIFGIFAFHPVMNFPLPWWIRGTILGAWMNFVLVLFCYPIIESTLSLSGFQISPFWIVLEGAVICMLFDYLLTRWFGEGWADKN